VPGRNCAFNNQPVNAGWENRELVLVEQFETTGTTTNFSLALAFSADSAVDPDGDGLVNTNELAVGTDPLNPDSDGDRMPDGWEIDHELDPLADDALLDPDDDGFSNAEEFVADTHPRDERSFLQAEAISIASPVHVFFHAATSRVYTLQADADIGSAAWSNVPGQVDVRFPEGGTQSLFDLSITNNRLYRIRVDLPP
jgi:hypothetical protein